MHNFISSYFFWISSQSDIIINVRKAPLPRSRSRSNHLGVCSAPKPTYSPHIVTSAKAPTGSPAWPHRGGSPPPVTTTLRRSLPSLSRSLSIPRVNRVTSDSGAAVAQTSLTLLLSYPLTLLSLVLSYSYSPSTSHLFPQQHHSSQTLYREHHRNTKHPSKEKEERE
ncbi:hypothetical protein TWF506_001744 [Arthrobotrys conoides]|uniref:Uncharacterized protein n=1 Tax=Arthrobotrys conoides TaxID=74498 RepID=A0AAN8NNB4_9PEZI